MKLIVSVSFVFAASVAFSTGYTWKGGSSGAWAEPANWEPSGTPGAGDVAYFPSATEITGNFAVGDGTLVITNGAGTLSFDCSISGTGHLDLRGCGEKRYYRDSTFSGGLEAHGTGYRPDGTFITFNGSVAGDSGAVRIYAGGALGTGTAAIGEKRASDADGAILTTGARLYVEGDLTVTTPLLIGFPRDGLNNLTMNSSLVTFSANVTATDRLYMELLKADGHCHFTESKFYVPGYMETMSRGHYHFYGTAAMGTFYGNLNTYLHLHAWGKVTYAFVMYRGTTVCEAEDVIDWANASDSIQFTSGTTSTLDLNGYDQTIAKIRPAANKLTFHSDSVITCPVESPAKLRFVGLETGTPTFEMSSRLNGSAGIVWAPTSSDATLTLSGNTASTTTGDLIVSNGTLRLVGYSLGSLSTIYVCNGATLDLDDASLDALGANRLFVEESASVVLGSSSGGTANIRRVTLVDTGLQTKSDLTPGETYTESDVPQFSGPGTISIPMPTVTTWDEPVSGLWTDSQKWSYGMPSESIAAEITADGSDYTVTVGNAKVPGLAVHNHGEGAARLVAEGTLDLSDATVSFGAGSELAVADGGKVEFLGTASAVGNVPTVTLESGAAWTVTGEVDIVKTKFQLAKGASLEFAGEGKLNRNTPSATKTWALWAQSGASLLFRDDAVYEIMYTFDIVFGSGRTIFRDRAKLQSSIVYNESARMYFQASDAVTPCEVYFEDDSSCNLTYASMTETRARNGRAHVEFNSTGTHTLGYWQLGGNDPGIAEAVITKGQVKADGSSGFIMSGLPGMYPDLSYNSSSATSLLQVVEGSLWVAGGSAAGNNCLYGFIVGAGAPQVGSPLARARIELSGGAITNSNEKSMFLVGVGRSVGEIVQTGGEFVSLVTDSRCPNVIGLQNGQALYALSNGVARITNPIYVGGCTTNTLCRNFLRDRGGLVDAFGQVTVAAADPAKSCLFAAEGDMILGGLGRGVLETGPGGTLTAANLVLSNNVSSLVRCRVDDRGAGLIDVSGKLVVTDGASLEVDASALTQPLGHAVTLIEFGSMEGSFAPGNVRVVGGPSGTEVVIRPDRISLKSPKGLVLIVR